MKRPNSKISWVSVTGATIAAGVLAYSEWRGLSLTDREISGFVTVVIVLLGSVGYVVPDNRPSPSAKQALLQLGWSPPVPPDEGQQSFKINVPHERDEYEQMEGTE